MNEKDMIRISKRLARHLRHAPEEIGIRLTADGWTDVEPLITALGISRDQHADGHVFRLSANGVWLTAHVPAHHRTQV